MDSYFSGLVVSRGLFGFYAHVFWGRLHTLFPTATRANLICDVKPNLKIKKEKKRKTEQNMRKLNVNWAKLEYPIWSDFDRVSFWYIFNHF